MKFITYAPGEYNERGGGCIALHRLAHNIALCGEESYIMSDNTSANYKSIVVNEAEAKELAKGDAIVIYPEVIERNPLNAKNVMRWILYFVRDTGDHGIYGERDLIYKYAPHFTLRKEREINGYLRASELNLDLFVDRGEERSGACYLVKKGYDNWGFNSCHPEDAIKLDEYRGADWFNYLADVFNYCETFYCYDNASWLSIIAAQCGCKSIVVPDGSTNPLDWYKGFPYFKYGIAYGQSELKHAELTRHLLIENLKAIEAEAMEQTKEFIKTAYKNKL